MRRKLGYIFLTGSLILGCAALIGPTIVSLDTDVTYGSGQELVFKISEGESTYGGISTADYVNNDDYVAVDAVAEEMENRLDEWGIEATVKKEGYDTIRVAVRAQDDDETDYTYLRNYLSFSGGDITCGASLDEDNEGYNPVDSWNTMFDGQTARIEYVSVSTGDVPAVVIPVNNKEDFGDLIDYCTENTKAADSSAGTEEVNCYLVLWSHKQTGDTWNAAYDTSSDSYDPNVSKRLIFAEYASQAWYDDDHTEFQIIPSSAALSADGYDPSKADAAYQAALYYKSILNASSYLDIGAGYDVNYVYSEDIAPSVEPLVESGAWALHPNFGTTAIASLVSILFVAVILFAFYRLGALAILANMGFTIMGCLLLFSYFSAQFGLGALLGAIFSCLIAAFGGVYYFAKFREQIYQGRTTKKAHQEAIKRSLWPTIDVSIVSIIIGLCVYGFVPGVVGKLGLMLILGGFFAGVANLLLLRLEGWFLANDKSVEENYAKVYGINKSKVPDLAKGEEPSYFGPYAQTDFTKHSKIYGIISSALVVAGIVGLSVFMSLDGVAYNFSNDYSESSVSTIEYRTTENETLAITGTDRLETDVLQYVYEGENPIAYSDVTLEEGSVYITDAETDYSVHYYRIVWDSVYDEGASYDFVVHRANSSETASYTNLTDALYDALSGVGLSEEDEQVTVRTSILSATPGLPTMASMWLGIGIGVLASTVYMCLRYKLSRGLASGILAAGAAVVATGFYSLARVAVTPTVSMGGVAAALLVFILAIFILAKAKELSEDSREKEKTTLSFRAMCLKTANSQAAGDLIVYALLASFSGLLFMGFISDVWRAVFGGVLVALICAAMFVLTLLTPISDFGATLFSRIHLSFRPRKKDSGKGNGPKQKSGEPEEAIFIGIND
jgi:preprotein translocase subunit SecF